MVDFSSFPQGFRAVVVGASGAIGAAMVQHLQASPRCSVVVGLGRNLASAHQEKNAETTAYPPALDFADEGSVARAFAALKANYGAAAFHLIINATGTLHHALPDAQDMPEKRLGQLNYAQMEQIFRINTFGPALVLAHAAPLLSKDHGVMAVLSAKVGSIGDNRLGGWYSYRASKAALNMLLKTASIEVARTNPQAVLVALHPGTVDSALSAPFKGAEIGRPASDAAADMLRVLNGLAPAQSGGFYAYSGEELPW